MARWRPDMRARRRRDPGRYLVLGEGADPNLGCRRARAGLPRSRRAAWSWRRQDPRQPLIPGRIETDRLRVLDAINAKKAGVTPAEQPPTAAAIPLGRYGLLTSSAAPPRSVSPPRRT
jgi:hypothetical protein